MNVHVVVHDLNQDRILTRLGQYLAVENGWTLGTRPRDDVDFNFFSVYIDYAERFHDWHKTPVGAYFSHHEPDNPQKDFWWQQAAQRVDWKIVTAKRYADMLGGRTSLVVPPVDPQFKPERRAMGMTPVVGLAGYVPPRKKGDRKGIKALQRIMGAKTAQAWNFVATGRRWPIHCQERPWGEMVGFYQGLHVFLCTSKIEGIPMPPLEALACGVPVVVPAGVGMLDSLNGPGVYHYNAPNAIRALQAAIAYRNSDEYDPHAVAANVQDFTPTNFAQGVERAVRLAALDATEPAPIESSAHGKRGVYVVAYGGPARKCASHLIDTVRQWLPGVEVALASDAPLNGEDHLIKLPDADIGGRAAKTQIADVVPEEWQYILYLDADTELVADVSFLFEVLEDGWDAVICRNPGKYHTIRKMIRVDNRDECEYTFRQLGTDELIQLNGGVFGFQRNHRTTAFFHTWHKEWQRWGKRDQAALLRALFAHPLRLLVLGNQWNTITRYVTGDPMRYTAGILHYPMVARRWRGIIDGRLDSKEAWTATRNFKVGG